MPFIQVPPDSTGKLVDTVSPGSAHRQVVSIGDPNSTSGLVTVTSSGGVGVTILAGAAAGSTELNLTLYSGPGATVTSSAGLMTNISSGNISLSGGLTITTTSPFAATLTSSGFTQVFVTGSSGAAAVVTSSGGMFVHVTGGVSAASAISYSTNTVLIPFLFNSSSSASLIVVTTSAKMLYGWNVASQSSQQCVIRIYNSTGPTVGSTSLLIAQIPIPGSSVGAGSNIMLQSGINFSSAMALVIIDNFITTSTAVTQHVGGDIVGTLYLL